MNKIIFYRDKNGYEPVYEYLQELNDFIKRSDING